MAARDSLAAQALQGVPFFANLQEDHAGELAGKLVPRRFGPNQVIFHLGDPGGLLYLISRGKVKISHTTPDGQEVVLAILSTGDFFGELALLDDSPRSATAVALEPTETWTLHRAEFMQYLSDNPGFALHVLKTLARVLLNLSEQYGRKTQEGIQIELSLTQTDLADMTGATRVSINKALGRFRRAGWIRVNGRRVTVLDEAALRELIEVSGGDA